MAAPEDLVVLKRSEDTTVTVHLYGATLISWKCKNEEKIFVSSKSLFDNKKAIRGGIPIVFPQFGPWEFGPQHGFARINRWSIAQYPTKTADGDVEAKFSLSDNEATRSMWNYGFKLIYKVVLKETSLVTELSIKNTGCSLLTGHRGRDRAVTHRVLNERDYPVINELCTESFSFTCLLHTYLQVPYIQHVSISGLNGCTYVDKVNGGKREEEVTDALKISSNVDSIYVNTGVTHEIIQDNSGKSLMKVEKENFPETVVWNPWEEKARAMADMGNEDYLCFVCIEPGVVDKPLTLPPGTAYTASQTLSAA